MLGAPKDVDVLWGAAGLPKEGMFANGLTPLGPPKGEA